MTDIDYWAAPAPPLADEPGVARAMREPGPGWGEDRHTCEPVGESAYPGDVVGDDLSRWLAHPCIGWEAPATSCDLGETEAAIRVMPLEAAAELYLWARTMAGQIRGKSGFGGHAQLLDALCADLAAKPRLAAVVRGWENETKERRETRVRRAFDALDPEERRRDTLRDMGDAAADAAPLPEPLGQVG